MSILNEKEYDSWNHDSGFTLIELLVVMVIVLIVTGISFFQFREYSKGRVVEQTAYEIALLARQAQTYGISSTDTDDIWEEANSVEPTGIYLDYSSGSFGTDIVVFRDSDYSTGGASEFNPTQDSILEVFTLPSGLILFDVATTGSLSDDVTITFRRPSPEPHIYELGDPGYDSENDTEKITITLSSFDEENSRDIVIEPTGYVYISAES
jgi:prepilin-type N-terminal cleavage/methylation domain-containing protein